MSSRTSRTQDPTRSSETSRTSRADVRRERARLAQQRSRARTRAELQSLTTRVQALSAALDETTKIFLDFSNEALARCDTSDNELGMRSIRDYMERYLAIVRRVTEEEAEADDQTASNAFQRSSSEEAATDFFDDFAADLSDNPEFSPQVQASLPSIPLSNAPNRPMSAPTSYPQRLLLQGSASSEVDRQSFSQSLYSPRLGFGLLVPPPDPNMPANLEDSRTFLQPTFASKLFWNSLRFGFTLLSSNSTVSIPLLNYKYHFALRHDPKARITTRMRRRLATMPDNIPIYLQADPLPEVPSLHCRPSPPNPHGPGHAQTAPPVYPDDVDEELERANMKNSHEKIAQSMYLEGEDINNYLKPKDVQSRLLHTWGIDADAESSKEDLHISKSASTVEMNPLFSQATSQQSSSSRTPQQFLSYRSSTPSTSSLQNPQGQMNRKMWSSLQSESATTQQIWTAEAVANLWPSFIVRLVMDGRCTGDGAMFPIKTVDDFAQRIISAGGA